MKYLKRIFEEVSQGEYERLLDFCEGNLVYLLDDIWKLKINKKTAVYPNTGYYDIVIYTFNNGNSVPDNYQIDAVTNINIKVKKEK